MIRGLRAWHLARAHRRTIHQEWARQTLDAALADALSGHELGPAVTDNGWTCARGRLSSGATLEVRLSGGGLLDVVIGGVVVGTDFPWDGPLEGVTPGEALTDSLSAIFDWFEAGRD